MKKFLTLFALIAFVALSPQMYGSQLLSPDDSKVETHEVVSNDEAVVIAYTEAVEIDVACESFSGAEDPEQFIEYCYQPAEKPVEGSPPIKRVRPGERTYLHKYNATLARYFPSNTGNFNRQNYSPPYRC